MEIKVDYIIGVRISALLTASPGLYLPQAREVDAETISVSDLVYGLVRQLQKIHLRFEEDTSVMGIRHHLRIHAWS